MKGPMNRDRFLLSAALSSAMAMAAMACNGLLGNDSVSLWSGNDGGQNDGTLGDTGAGASVGDEGGDGTVDASMADESADTTMDATSAPETSSDATSDSGTDGGACTDECTAGAAECASGGGAIQKCEVQANGCTQWVTTSTCGAHQACTGGSAPSCACTSSICAQAGAVCQDGQTLATCTIDGSSCPYVASTSTCPGAQSCSGTAPSAACSLTCTSSCTSGQTSCVSGGLATCTLGTNGCWAYGPPATCPSAYQTCTGSAGSAACTCKADAVCTTVGPACVSNSSLASCARDGYGCVYKASSSTCSNGACSGPSGSAACCTNTCTIGAAPACLSTSSTQIQACATGGNGCTALSATACSSGLVCERYATPACVDPNWAEWPVPNDVTEDPGSPNAASYTDNGNGTVTDNVTGLVWQQSAPSTTFTWGSASASGTAQYYCATLTLAGYSDWRLPSVIELSSLVDTADHFPALNTTYFIDGQQTYFWSSTPLAGSSTSAWEVYFAIGDMSNMDGSTANSARCVR